MGRKAKSAVNVVVTGGRDFDDRDLVFRVLDEIHKETPITLIRNGGMTGADALSSRWAYERQVDTDCVGARWGTYGKRAGPIRNAAMLAGMLPSDIVVAFPGGRGTAHTIVVARRLGCRIREVVA